MNKTRLERYAEIKNDIKRLEEEAKEIAPQILEEMGDVEEVSTDFGTFIVAKRRQYTYPETLVKAQEELDAAKEQAVQTGEAVYTEKPYLIFKTV